MNETNSHLSCTTETNSQNHYLHSRRTQPVIQRHLRPKQKNQKGKGASVRCQRPLHHRVATSAAATANLRNRGNASVAPAPQLTNSADGPSDEQMEAMRAAEADAGEAERTLGTYEKKEGKIGRIPQKKWFIVDPRSSKIVPYWDAVGIVRCSPACNCGCYHPGRRTLSLARGRSLHRG